MYLRVPGRRLSDLRWLPNLPPIAVQFATNHASKTVRVGADGAPVPVPGPGTEPAIHVPKALPAALERLGDVRREEDQLSGLVGVALLKPIRDGSLRIEAGRMGVRASC